MKFSFQHYNCHAHHVFDRPRKSGKVLVWFNGLKNFFSFIVNSFSFVWAKRTSVSRSEGRLTTSSLNLQSHEQNEKKALTRSFLKNQSFKTVKVETSFKQKLLNFLYNLLSIFVLQYIDSVIHITYALR